MNSEHSSKDKDGTLAPKPPDIYSDDRILLAWHRSHLANERTFLSWSRTSISLLAFGFVIERFELFLRQWFKIQGLEDHLIGHHSIVYLALFSFLLAGVSIALSGLRFMQARKHINRGEAIFTIVPDVLVITSVAAIIIIAVVLSLPRLYEILGPF
jgi:putative membrane protein